MLFFSYINYVFWVHLIYNRTISNFVYLCRSLVASRQVEKGDEMIRVLFVCTGNTCRSPMAEAILRNKAGEEIEVKSAGIFAGDGSPASANTAQVLKEKGIECQHSSSFLTQEHIDWATYVLTMTSHHKQAILQSFPEAHDKVHTLKEFTNGSGEISDPFGGPVEIYRETYAELEPLIDEVLSKLK